MGNNGRNILIVKYDYIRTDNQKLSAKEQKNKNKNSSFRLCISLKRVISVNHDCNMNITKRVTSRLKWKHQHNWQQETRVLIFNWPSCYSYNAHLHYAYPLPVDMWTLWKTGNATHTHIYTRSLDDFDVDHN